MKGLKQLRDFYGKANLDQRLLPSHISLYFAIIWKWRNSGFANKFKVVRKELMQLSHIQSIATYHKCIQQLCSFGYVVYASSYDHYKGSEISLAPDKSG